MGHIQMHGLSVMFFVTNAQKRSIKCGIHHTPEQKHKNGMQYPTPMPIYFWAGLLWHTTNVH